MPSSPFSTFQLNFALTPFATMPDMLDTHHHLWSYNTEEYSWIPEGTPLAQDQLLPELQAATTAAAVSGTIAVQARQTVAESQDLLRIAEHSDLIKGVVGWVPLIEESVSEHLDKYSSHEKYVGVRHVLQDEPDEYFLRSDFHRGLSQLPQYGLKYDLLLFQRQLPVALKLVDQQPELEIIIDHIAKPEARNGRIEEGWKKGMKEMARRENVRAVKFSGLVTEFNHDGGAPIDPQTIAAYFHETLEIFGSERVTWGTDWPVCLLRTSSYKDWVDTVRTLLNQLSQDEQEALSYGNGAQFYGV